MTFYDEHNNKVDTVRFELPEQYLSSTYVEDDATVLELGARYGTVSCAINKKLKDKYKQVSVEPDQTVWNVLEENIKRNGMAITLHKGFVSTRPKQLNLDGYSSMTTEAAESTISISSVSELQSKYNIRFNTLVADCEGFLETFFDEHPFLYDQLHTVIFEADQPAKCNYAKIRDDLKRHGFREIIHGFQNVYKK
jgi:FkbM family methyltransferase